MFGINCADVECQAAVAGRPRLTAWSPAKSSTKSRSCAEAEADVLVAAEAAAVSAEAAALAAAEAANLSSMMFSTSRRRTKGAFSLSA